MQNGYIESFKGKFRDECLNEHWFETLHQARTAIATWRQDYNSSCRRTPPALFAALLRHQAAEAAQAKTGEIL
jgi:putative transposase